MEVALSVLFVYMCVYVHAVKLQGEYDTYNLDSVKLCKHKSSGSIYIRPWKAVILTFGNPPGSQLPPPGRNIHECKVTLSTHENFGLAAVIENMSIAATLNRKTHAWECDGDYLKISTIGKSTISKILSIIPGDFLRSKKTKELCGLRKGKPRFTEVGSTADVFSTIANTMEVTFHQAYRKTSPLNNSFRIVITTFKFIKEVEDCQDKYQCKGSENYCISPEYVCDSHYNCGAPLGGGDEVKCQDPETYSIFSTTTTIITILASIVGSAFLIACIITLARKMHAQTTAQSRSITPRPGLMSEGSAPPLQRQHTLPPYEAVVMADADPSWKSSNPETLAPGELPPNYESLFPDGPPTAPSVLPPIDQPSTTTAPTNQEEHHQNTATAQTSES